MKLGLALILVLSWTPMLRGQETPEAQNQDDDVVQKLLEKMRDLRPPNWTYSDLAAKSDLIVIARAKSRMEVKWNDKIGGDFGKGTTKLMSNRLQILSALKGQADDEIDVMTLEWKPDVIVLTNFDFAELRPKLLLPVAVPVIVAGEIVDYAKVIGGSQTYTVKPEYLLYLRRIDGGKYVAVTGQRYSGASVRRLK